METTLQILEYAMTMERQGEQFYLKYRDEIEGKRFREVFENLAKVEAEHYDILKREFELLRETGRLEKVDIQLSGGSAIFEKIMQEEKHMLDPEEDLSLNDIAILRMAYLMENDFTDFYLSAAEKACSPAASDLLRTLASWEKAHRDLFQAEYRYLMEEKWGEQQFAPF